MSFFFGQICAKFLMSHSVCLFLSDRTKLDRCALRNGPGDFFSAANLVKQKGPTGEVHHSIQDGLLSILQKPVLSFFIFRAHSSGVRLCLLGALLEVVLYSVTSG